MNNNATASAIEIQEGQQVTYQGEIWNVLSLGVTNDEGMVFAHLAHPTRKNGIHPVQVNDWIAPFHPRPCNV